MKRRDKTGGVDQKVKVQVVKVVARVVIEPEIVAVNE